FSAVPQRAAQPTVTRPGRVMGRATRRPPPSASLADPDRVSHQGTGVSTGSTDAARGLDRLDRRGTGSRPARPTWVMTQSIRAGRVRRRTISVDRGGA